MSNRSSLNWQVLDLINDLIAERGVSKTELVELSGIKRNTLFVKLRGETALTTDDIARLAEALGADPELILRKAWVGRMSERDNVIVGRFGQNAGISDLERAAMEFDGETGEDHY